MYFYRKTIFYSRCFSRGFSLLELMAVVVIIGIFSALAIPGIVEIRSRNTLTDSVERIRSAGAATRDFAMQTRKAAVLEISSDGVWINLLSGPKCNDEIELRCASSLGDETGFISLYDSEGIGATAGIAMCGGSSLSTASASETACSSSVALSKDTGFALCYSGSGDLFFRASADENTVCGGTGSPDDSAIWTRACSTSSSSAKAVSFADSTSYNLSDGAVLMLNRYPGDSLCADGSASLDIRRIIVFPTNGAPFSQVSRPGVSAKEEDTE